jgi:hypothetical protein
MIILKWRFKRITLQLGKIEIRIIVLFQILKFYFSFTNRLVTYRLRDFSYERKRASSLEWHGDLKGFQTAIYLRGCIKRTTFNTWRPLVSLNSHSPVRRTAPACSRFHYHTHQRLHSICFACKVDGKIFLLLPFFIFYF